jgi:hypothetical protein
MMFRKSEARMVLFRCVLVSSDSSDEAQRRPRSPRKPLGPFHVGSQSPSSCLRRAALGLPAAYRPAIRRGDTFVGEGPRGTRWFGLVVRMT